MPADYLGMTTFDGTVLPEVVAFDLRHLCYVDGAGTPLDFDTTETLGFDGTLRDIPSQLVSYRPYEPPTETFEQAELRKMAERDALRDALFSSYAFEDLNEDEYRQINERVYTVLGEDRVERLASICTGERWSPEDMMHVAFNPDDLLMLLARLDCNEEED